MRPLFFISVLSFLLCLPTLSHASFAEEFSIGDIKPRTVYANTDNVLALDVTIPRHSGTDFVDNITLYNQLGENSNTGIKYIRVWTDGGDPGFQGINNDILYTNAEWDTVNKQWLLRNLHLYIPSSGLRLFFTITTTEEITEINNFKLAIPELLDENHSNSYNYGDRGVFTRQNDHGPRNADVASPVTLIISPNVEDLTTPVVTFENVTDNSTLILEDNLNCEISGQISEDQGSNVRTAEINLLRWDNNTWQPHDKITEAAVNLQNFPFTLPCPLQPGQYHLQVRADNALSPGEFTDANVTFNIATNYTKYVNGWYKIIEQPKQLFVNVQSKLTFDLRAADFYTARDNVEIKKFSPRNGIDEFSPTISLTNEQGLADIYIKPTRVGTTKLTFSETGVDFAILNYDVTGSLELGTLFKFPESSSIYYYATNGKRYVFPNSKIYFSWFDNFDNVVTIDPAQGTAIPFGGVITYKPAVKMIKLQTDPKVYAVAPGGKLRWVKDETIAKALYGDNWNKKIDDISDAFYVNYQLSDPIESPDGFNLSDNQNIETNLSPPLS